eukprot:CAMPEP_0194308778 /NCGR_PEP_ID=MMETSP0171-20130528/5738_1 /TAXON_ID=218684 /ORGANISM="Corethron pennatum, Strain L29A3" /LENGTH=300 /DNA_ID=CAMNT_0039061579 /DNA_START=313 /DNA_END=1215 /DNA_ORIENTATION=-
MKVIHQDAEISRRRKIWCQSVSSCLPVTSVDAQDSELSDDNLESADDPTFNEDANLKTLKKESDYYNILGKWCGGWPQLLYAREAGAPLPPIGPSLSTPCEDSSVLLWDIRCDGVWKWSGTQPLNRNQLGNMQEISELFGLFRAFPFWKKTVGDEIRHTLWSGCASDHRSWEFSVSLLSSQCSETLLHSHTIVPSHLVETIEAAGGFRPTTDSLMLGDMEPDDRVTFCDGTSDTDPEIISPERDVVGIDDDGSICSIFQDFDFHVFSDKRQPGVRRIHLMWAYNAHNTLFSKMIVNPSPR